jgi:hypothetical protein
MMAVSLTRESEDLKFEDNLGYIVRPCQEEEGE